MTWDLPYGDPQSLDYIKSSYFSNGAILGNLCEQLYRINPYTGQPEPDLATSVSRPNPLTLVYTIRKGVRFWDGHLLTAEDAAYSLEREIIPALGGGQAIFFAYVTSIAATGPHQVTIRFSKPNYLLQDELATNSGFIAEAAYLKKAGKSYGTPHGGIMCTGPYKLVSWTSGSDLVMTANPDYWDKALTPKVKTITFDFVASTSALTTGLLSGSFDGSFDVPAAIIPALRSATVGHLYYGPSTEQDLLLPVRGLMTDPRIRQALSLALNRAQIAKVAYSGAATPLLSIVPPYVFGSNDPSLLQSAYNQLPGATPDVPRAKALVREAGSPQTPITFGYLGGDQVQLDVGSILQADAAAIGLHVKLVPLTNAQVFSIDSGVGAPSNVDLVFFPNYNLFRTPVEEPGFFVEPPPGGYVNFDHYSNPTVTRDLLLSLQTADVVKSDNLFIAAQKAWQTQDTAVIPVVAPDEVAFANNKVTGFPTVFPYFFYPWATMVGASGS